LQARRSTHMGNPPCANIFKFASNALDTRRVRHHVHEPVSSFLTPCFPRPTPTSRSTINAYWCLPRAFSTFFRKGQVLETFRGEGIYQPAVDLAIEKLRAGAWVRRVSIHVLNRDVKSLFLCRYTCLERAKFVNPIRTRRIHKLGLRDCSASGGACA
jgi:hypothetical protein